MKEWTSTLLAVSLAGRDKGSLYVVLDSDETWVWLTDGKRRRLENPKRKKWKHVQVIRHLPEELLAQMRSFTLDAHVRKILAEYRKDPQTAGE